MKLGCTSSAIELRVVCNLNDCVLKSTKRGQRRGYEEGDDSRNDSRGFEDVG